MSENLKYAIIQDETHNCGAFTSLDMAKVTMDEVNKSCKEINGCPKYKLYELSELKQN